MRQAYFIAGLILGLAIAVFAPQNTTAVEVKFLAWQVTGSLAVVVLGSAAAGALVALRFGIPEIMRPAGACGTWNAASRELPPKGQGRRSRASRRPEGWPSNSRIGCWS
jgi:uncharacterized integral membrane protein